MSFAPDLAAYFARIGHDGTRAPTRQNLDAIVLAHVRAVPFENLDVLLGRAISLAPSAIEDKLVHARRGGYCFEHNGYLLEVLRALGFVVSPLSARVRIGRPRTMIPARTHMCLRVELEGESLLVDVGVGALSPTAPLRLDLESEQATPHEARRLLREGHWHGALRDPSARVLHQAKLGDDWHDVAELTLEEMPEIDRVVANWYTSTHPESHFKGRLMVARASESGRVTIADDELSLRGGDGVAEKRRLHSHDALLEALDQHFGMRLPSGTVVPMPRSS